MLGFGLGRAKAKKRKAAIWAEEETKRPPPAALMGAGATAMDGAATSAGDGDPGDPLDEFMSEVTYEVKLNKPKTALGRGEELETGDDAMDGYRHKDGTSRSVGDGDNSDDEVYAAAKAADKKVAAAGDDDGAPFA
jgi:hypothetical protein